MLQNKTLDANFYQVGDGSRLARLSNFTIFVIGALFLFLLIWSAFAEIDEVTRGDGKVIPSQKIQSIQSSEPGVVEQILVRLGQHVAKGDLLIRLDNTMTESNLGEDEAKARSLEAQIARLEIERTGDRTALYVCPDDLKAVAADVCATEALLLQTRRAEQSQKLDSLREKIEERQREFNEAKDESQRIAQGLGLAQQEFDLISPMVQKRIAPKTDLLNVERDLVDLKGQQAANQQVIARTDAALREANNNLADAALQIQSDALADLSKASAEFSVIRETIKGAKEHNRRTDIRSPVDGIINTLDTNTIGAFVNAGSHVMDIVPLEDKLLIETKVKPRDIAFVRPGQKALVKLTAYDFSIYGGLKGVVQQVSADSVYDDKAHETFYIILVATDESTLRHNGATYPIMPGMISQVDIVTGRKTILQYLLKPIFKARDESLTER
ncbi:MAG TPA: HlyD family type I secretion periplasmic adaptor subunit [Methylovirgula sp.]